MRVPKLTSLFALVFLPLCNSHFIILTPPPLGNNINNEDQSPCGGFNPSSSDNITDFHVGGDAIGLTTLHAQAYFAYRGLQGTSLSAPNWTVLIPTVEEFGLNSFCQPAITAPASWAGSAGLLQVIQDAEDGVHYQCMHVNFVAGVGTPPSACSNSSGVSAQYADDPAFDTIEGSASPAPSSTQASTSPTQATSPSTSSASASASSPTSASAAPPTMRLSFAEIWLLAGLLALMFAANFEAYYNGDLLAFLLDPEVAYECLSSIPVIQEHAEALVASLRGYLEMQSTLDYLSAPTTGWLFPPVDIVHVLSQIWTKLVNNQYSSEYDLQVDLHTMTLLGKDDHFITKGPLLNALTFERRPDAVPLISLSEDGKQIPSVYLLWDRFYQGEQGELKLRSDHAYSAITKINGIDVQEFLQVESLTGTSQDLDSLYNGMMHPYGLFESPEFYPGPYTNYTFQNGSVMPFRNYANWRKNNLTGVANAIDMYALFFQTVDLSSDDGEDDPDSDSASAHPRKIVKRQVPAPAIYSDDAGAISGYWGDGIPDDVAVLTISGFSPADSGGSDSKSQKTLQAILEATKELGKEKLIIDLRQNGGGSVRLCLETMVQLFPDTPPDTKSSMRANGAQKAIVEYFSEQTRIAENADPSTGTDVTEVDAERSYSPWAYQTVMSPKVKPFNNMDHYYGPYREGPGYFTSYFQENYTNNEYSMIDHSEIVLTQAVPGKQWPYSPENMIILTDGICASACSIFVEHLKNKFRVMSIVIGGRPQTGPMQTIGGVRGSRLFEYPHLVNMLIAYQNQTTANPDSADPTFDNWDYGPASRFGTYLRVNGFNAYRLGEPHNIPLHFAYEAADCRIWYTPEMIEDDKVLWSRVAELAFGNRVGDVIESPYCVDGSTKHPTSISGGVRQGDLGPQTPPDSAFPQYTGWIVNGTQITQDDLGRAHGFGPGAHHEYEYDDDSDSEDEGTGVDPVALENFKDLCSQTITEEQWFLKLMCLNVQ
ncbi:hypothetical protein AYL99_02009 [Fonsecaea erecta]|uniref:Uncharacterized protein n=1 Tax=Fonsecaea erecta TaxID=1367422 RepID=A0A178ZSU2_9EURO|nr:hypothetical protein AYL99_02009 [Fonsecaea erecta]OAP62782.1 hypothetical protein AYL99_02009 [Fonsecaea erecta]